jgi:hypothetical protein
VAAGRVPQTVTASKASSASCGPAVAMAIVRIRYGSDSTCWWLLKEWHEGGVWKRLYPVLFDTPINLIVEGFRRLVHRAGGRGRKIGANPMDRDKLGTKCHLVVEARGVPLAAVLSAAYVHGSRVMLEVVNATEPIRHCRRGWLRKQPGKLNAGKAYDSADLRAASVSGVSRHDSSRAASSQASG